MTEASIPTVGIGMPVYNGEKYIEDALRSIVEQDFDDFELVISDNASTDGTGDVLSTWAARDRRISVHENEVNLGGADNFNRVLHLSRGKYFRWATHDDLLAKEMLRVCVEALDAEDESCVLVYPQTVVIDDEGNEVEVLEDQLILDSDDPIDRLREFIRSYRLANVIYGLMRTDAIKDVGGLPKYIASDLVMIAGLALRGRFVEIPQPLFQRRLHEDRSWKSAKTSEGFARWFDPNKRWLVVFRAWRQWRELLMEVWKAPLTPSQKSRAILVVLYAWPQREWKRLIKEIARVPVVLWRSRQQAQASPS